MHPALGGGLSALLLGSADFAGRFTTRAMGAPNALFGVLSVGCVVLTGWVWVAGPALPAGREGWWLLVVSGVFTTVMTLLLYAALARGPISLVAPVVAAHPALVVAFYVALGARPSALEWAGMAVTVAGVVLVARSTDHFLAQPGYSRRHLRRTLWMATGAALCYVLVVVAGQRAVPIYGDLDTLWLGRLLSLASLLALFAVLRRAPRVPRAWWPVVGAQGLMDTGGYLCLFAASGGPGDGVAAVAASTFGAVTTLLARFVLNETVSGPQWCGIALIVAGVGTLSASG